MRWLLKYWKPALAALLLALIAAWQADRRTQYRRGQTDKAAEISLALAKAAQTQNENTLNQERQARQKLHAAQAAIEKERNHAQTVAADMRRELDRLRQHAARQSGSRNLPATAATAAAPDGAESAEGWELLGKCAAEYAGLAETADSQAADLREWQAYGGAVSKQFKQPTD